MLGSNHYPLPCNIMTSIVPYICLVSLYCMLLYQKGEFCPELANLGRMAGVAAKASGIKNITPNFGT